METRHHALIAGIFTLLMLLQLAAGRGLVVWRSREIGQQLSGGDAAGAVSDLIRLGQVRYQGIQVGRRFDPARPRRCTRHLIPHRGSDERAGDTGTIARSSAIGTDRHCPCALEDTGRTAPLTGDNGCRVPMRRHLLPGTPRFGTSTMRQARELLISANQCSAEIKRIGVRWEHLEHWQRAQCSTGRRRCSPNPRVAPAQLNDRRVDNAAAEEIPGFPRRRRLNW